MPTIAFITLGCKVNQYDTQAMQELFMKRGYILRGFHEPADVYVINTCTVTGTGDKKSMQAVRRAFRQNPDADVIIAGCMAQRDGEKLLSSGARLVIGTTNRAKVVDLLEEAIKNNERLSCVDRDILRVPFEPLKITDYAEHTRAAIKIQEGCDRYCTYCIIPYVRGGIRSREIESIRQEAEALVQNGFRELVLTGIHICSYGKDLKNSTLLDAIRAACVPGAERIRLGSLEPVIVDKKFAESLSEIPQICPQFHLSLQSGCDSVLKRMGRRYTAEQYEASVSALRRYMPDCAITTDIICGFPGETEDDFAQTLTFAKRIGFARVHAFPYSQRQGTPAAKMPDQLPKNIKEERTRKLIALAAESAQRYMLSMVGSVREVLFEEETESGSSGYTREYLRLAVPEKIPGGKICMCEVTGIENDLLTGRVIK